MKIKGRLEVDWIVDFSRTGAAVVNSKGKNILFIHIYFIFYRTTLLQQISEEIIYNIY